MIKKKLAIYGYGGHAREVAAQMEASVTFFVDDEYYSFGEALPISKFNPEEYTIMVAVADSQHRKRMVEKLPKNTEFFSFVHPTAIIYDATIGDGSFIGAYSILTTNIEIGNHAIVNRGNQIGHDCRIGDFFSIMPNAIIGGNVTIGDCVYLGSCSNVREKTSIKDNVIIGMNAAVVKDIYEPGTYVGVPAKQIK
jgi:sugar O-acyltransferase (sialic acid O-acetyltransferase NeuD family)